MRIPVDINVDKNTLIKILSPLLNFQSLHVWPKKYVLKLVKIIVKTIKALAGFELVTFSFVVKALNYTLRLKVTHFGIEKNIKLYLIWGTTIEIA